MNALFGDMKTDEEKAAFFLSGRGYETGVIAHSIQNDVAMAYHRCAEYKKELAALQAECDRLTRYYKNGIDCFANPCERHSGERTPPFSEFFEKYGGQCLICVVDNNKTLQAENERLVEALTIKNGVIEQLKARNSQLEDRNAALAVQVEARQVPEGWRAEVKGREAVGEVQLRTGGGISLLHADLTQPLPPGTKLYTAPQPAPAQDVAGLVNALKTIYDEDYHVPHDSTDGEIKEGMKRCVFRIRRIVKDALAAHDKQTEQQAHAVLAEKESK